MPAVDAVAVLASGGLDSSILVAQYLSKGRAVTPIYVRFGLLWEDVEIHHLRAFLGSLTDPRADPLIELDLPVADLYGAHWSLTGRDVPDRDSSDEAVFLPGRNLLLLAKTTVWCALNEVPEVALGTLAANPFPDADAEFFARFSSLAGRALGCPVEVTTPFAGYSKREVLDMGRSLPLSLTFSCIAPNSGHHCGSCNKCAERQLAFVDLGIPDTTEYAPC
jgi:7-cyano-7-deazaguanine synthase